MTAPTDDRPGNRHDLPLGDDRFWREVAAIPELVGHPWPAVAAYPHAELVKLETQLRLDITTIMAERRDGPNDPHWHHRSGRALGIKQQQLVAIRTMRRWRQLPKHPDAGTPNRGNLEHIATLCRVLLTVTDADDIALVEAEIRRTLDRITHYRPVDPAVILGRLRDEAATRHADVSS